MFINELANACCEINCQSCDIDSRLDLRIQFEQITRQQLRHVCIQDLAARCFQNKYHTCDFDSRLDSRKNSTNKCA